MKTRPANRSARVCFLAAAIGLLLMAGCMTDYDGVLEETGILYHYNWWNFYQRGSILLRQGKTEQAAQDFERCLGIRSGAKYGEDRDMWRARTYGMHFLEGYFPNRELGICLHDLGQTEKAARFLEISLQQAPSGRAKHYLNLVNQRLLTATKATPPTIDFARTSEVFWTGERHRTVEGTAKGQGLVNEVSINGKPLFVELAEQSVSFSEGIALRPGTNVVSVEAVDLLDQKRKKKLTWVADWKPPQLAITRMERAGNEWIVDGTCHDNLAVATVNASGASAFERKPGTNPKQVRITMRFIAGHQPVFTAEDLAGNKLETAISEELEDTGPAVAGSSPAMFDPQSWTQLASARATDIATDAREPILAAAVISNGPRVILADERRVFRVLDDEYFLDGAVADSGGIAAITVNNVEILPPANRGAIRAYFAHRVPLLEGENTVTITGRNSKGLTTARSLTIIRTAPEYMNEKFRLTMSFPPLPSSQPAAETQLIRRLLESKLLQVPVRFNLVEREEGWQQVLQELQISTSELADPRVALHISRIIPSDMILIASLISHKGGLTVYSRAIDTETGAVLDFDVYTENERGDLPYQMDGLAKKIKQRFPLLMAEVVGLSGRNATVNAGSRQGLSPLTSFVLVHNPQASPGVTPGEVCHVEGKLVKLKMKAVRDDTGTAKIHPRSAAKLIKEGDYVYAR